jgi:hypothetical protein
MCCCSGEGWWFWRGNIVGEWLGGMGWFIFVSKLRVEWIGVLLEGGSSEAWLIYEPTSNNTQSELNRRRVSSLASQLISIWQSAASPLSFSTVSCSRVQIPFGGIGGGGLVYNSTRILTATSGPFPTIHSSYSESESIARRARNTPMHARFAAIAKPSD